jgi:hypothetical protein
VLGAAVLASVGLVLQEVSHFDISQICACVRSVDFEGWVVVIWCVSGLFHNHERAMSRAFGFHCSMRSFLQLPCA